MALTIDWKRSENGPQRKRAVDGRLLHCCCECGHLGTWTNGWTYYGSDKELDDGAPVAKFCSDRCREKAGPRATNVGQAQKEHAKAEEWREPVIAYREETPSEKYCRAARRQSRLPTNKEPRE